MSLNKEAKVQIGVEGADQGAREFQRLEAAGVASFSKIAGAAVSSFAKLASSGVQAVASVAGLQKLDLGAAVTSLANYDKQVTMMAIGTGQQIDQLKAKFEGIGRQNLLPATEVERMTRSLGRVTYDFKGAADAVQGLRLAQLALGDDTPDDEMPFAVTLKSLGVPLADTEAQIGQVIAQADKLGTVGGPRALRDLFVGLGPALEQVSGEMDKGREKARAFAAALTAGLNPAQAQRVAGATFGGLQGNALNIQRTLGRDILDEHGHVKDPAKVLQDLSTKMKRRGMSEKSQLMAWRSDFGQEAGSELYYGLKAGKLTPEEIEKYTGLKSAKPKEAGKQYKDSNAGKRDAGAQAVVGFQKVIAEELLDTGTAAAGWLKENPATALLGAGAVKAVAPKLLGAVMRGGAQVGLGGSVSSLGGAGMAAGAYAALGLTTAAYGGYLAGEALDKIPTNTKGETLSDRVANGFARWDPLGLMPKGATTEDLSVASTADRDRERRDGAPELPVLARDSAKEQASKDSEQLLAALARMAERSDPQTLRSQLEAALQSTTVKVQLQPLMNPGAQVEDDKRNKGAPS